jgi:hypothetical protein
LTLHGTDLIAIAAMIACGLAGCYALFLQKLRATLTDRQMKIADQMARLDAAIRALETRLAQHQSQPSLQEPRAFLSSDNQNQLEQVASSEALEQEGTEIEPEIQAVIAAAAVAAVGPNAVVHSAKPVTSPWTQQGRVLVQGGHNLRVQR